MDDLVEKVRNCKRQVVPDGSIVAYNYTSKQVELIMSGKFSGKGHFEEKPKSDVKGFLSGNDGIILSRYIQGQWYDRLEAISFVGGQLSKKAG